MKEEKLHHLETQNQYNLKLARVRILTIENEQLLSQNKTCRTQTSDLEERVDSSQFNTTSAYTTVSSVPVFSGPMPEDYVQPPLRCATTTFKRPTQAPIVLEVYEEPDIPLAPPEPVDWKSNQFERVKKEDYFICFEFAKHTSESRRLYTKMIFGFYHTFCRGITVYSNGFVFATDVVHLYKKKVQKIAGLNIEEETKQLVTSGQDGMVDFYGT